jgi:hypothetical protein
MKKIKMVLHCELPKDCIDSDIDIALQKTIFNFGGKVIESEEYQEDDLYSDYELEIAPEWYYYEVHVFFGREDGYSLFFKSEEELSDEEEITEKAIVLFPDFEKDYGNYDYAYRIDKEDYYDAKGYGVDEAYGLYKIDWCKRRGYNLEDIDEAGVNGECYVSKNEFEDNEFQDVEYIESLFLDDLNNTLNKGRNK